MNQINDEEINILRNLLADCQSQRISRHLRNIFICYLQREHMALPIDFDEILIDLEQLFDILDFVEKIQCNNQSVAE